MEGIILKFGWYDHLQDENDYAIITVKDNPEFIWQLDETTDLCFPDDLLYAIVRISKSMNDIKFHSETDIVDNNEKFFPISESFFKLYEKRCIQRGEE